MTRRVALLSVACGIAWHTLITVLFGFSILDALSWGMVQGAVAGLAAGAFTIRSRTRRGGKESWWDVIVTYYLAVAIYILGGLVVTALQEAGNWSLRELIAAAMAVLFYGGLVATVLGVALIPLCLATRHLVWRFGGPDGFAMDRASD